MALKENARYSRGIPFARFWPLNGDKSRATPENILGGVGPFDFSSLPQGVTISTVPFIVKIDTGAAEELVVDLAGVVSQSAVTPAELASALSSAFVGETLDLDASVDPETGRIKVATTLTSDIPTWVQIYGLGAQIAGFGQGFGQKIVKTDSLRTFGANSVLKDSETITTTDADGDDTEIITDAYRKGATIEFVDTAEDWELLALIEGGTIDSNGSYRTPTSQNAKIAFEAELFYEIYGQGTNNQGDFVGYRSEHYPNCKGSVGERSHESGFMDGNFTINATSYRDKDTNELLSDAIYSQYTVSEFEALGLWDI